MAKKQVKKQVTTRTRIDEWREPDKIILLRGWAMDGLTIEQIAQNIGIGKTTIYEWFKKDQNIANAIKIGRDVADYAVENALFNQAKGGNVMAMMYWLNNRKPHKWKQRRQENTATSDQENEMLEQIKGLTDEIKSAGKLPDLKNDMEDLLNE